MTRPFNEAKYKALLEGLEVSEIQYSSLIFSEIRLDAEFFKKEYFELERRIKSREWISLNQANGILDCSAFYPSVADIYSFDGNGIPFLRVNDIADGQVIITDQTAYLPEHIVNLNADTIKIAQEHDILIAKGGNTAGKVGSIACKYPKYATCRDVIILRTEYLHKINASSLLIYLFSNIGKKLIEKTISQTGQPHLTLPLLGRLPVPVFSSRMQFLLAQYEVDAQKKSQASEFIYSDTEDILLAELGLQNWMPQQETISHKSFSNFQASGRLDAEYYQPKYDELFERLKHFETRQLGGKAGIVNIKKSIEPGSEAYQDSGIPFVRIADISKFGITPPDIFLDRSTYYDENLIAKKGTILLSKDGSVGIAYKLEEDLDAITSGALLHLSVKDSEFLPDYLTLVLNSVIVKMQAERDAGGSIIQHWKPSEIEKVVIPKLPMSTQESIAAKVQESFALRKESKRLLELAKHAVEIAIEQGEDAALKLLEKQ